jgi:hypothetical protein
VVSQSETLGVISDKPHNKIKTLFTNKKIPQQSSTAGVNFVVLLEFCKAFINKVCDLANELINNTAKNKKNLN